MYSRLLPTEKRHLAIDFVRYKFFFLQLLRPCWKGLVELAHGHPHPLLCSFTIIRATNQKQFKGHILHIHNWSWDIIFQTLLLICFIIGMLVVKDFQPGKAMWWEIGMVTCYNKHFCVTKKDRGRKVQQKKR